MNRRDADAPNDPRGQGASRRYGEYGPGGRSFEGEHDAGQSHRDGPGGRHGNFRAGQRGYAERPYTERSGNYNPDPRGARDYGYSTARGSMVSPEWDHYRDHGDSGPASPYEMVPSGREAGFGSRASYGTQGEGRYAGGDFGRGFQAPGRDRFDSDDADSRARMRGWSGHRGGGQYDSYGPYGGSGRDDEGRSGYRSSWGASFEQMAQGQDYRGRGPRGYARSDERLHEILCERMTEDPDIDPSDVSVQVRDGVVTLEGRVEDRWMKYHIEDLVDACSGVTEIENRIRVGRSAGDGESTTGVSDNAGASAAGGTDAPGSNQRSGGARGTGAAGRGGARSQH